MLLIRIRDAKDNAAWEQFIETYTPLIHRYCLNCCLEKADAANNDKRQVEPWPDI